VENSDHISQLKFVGKKLTFQLQDYETLLNSCVQRRGSKQKAFTMSRLIRFPRGAGNTCRTSPKPSTSPTYAANFIVLNSFTNNRQPDYSIPNIPAAETPLTNSAGTYTGMSQCESRYPQTRPTVPYGSQNESSSLATEQGFKSLRGDLTEGRYLVLEMNGFALTNSGNNVTATAATTKHEAKSQRWISHQLASGGKDFVLSSAVDGKFVDDEMALVADQTAAAVFTVGDLGNGAGHAFSTEDGYMMIASNGQVGLKSGAIGFSVFSVTYSS
jgi:phospholipase C